jgi:hypothetical protein
VWSGKISQLDCEFCVIDLLCGMNILNRGVAYNEELLDGFLLYLRRELFKEISYSLSSNIAHDCT